MKQLLTPYFILLSFACFAQTRPAGYEPVNSRSAPPSNDSVYWWPWYFESYTIWEPLLRPVPLQDTADAVLFMGLTNRRICKNHEKKCLTYPPGFRYEKTVTEYVQWNGRDILSGYVSWYKMNCGHSVDVTSGASAWGVVADTREWCSVCQHHFGEVLFTAVSEAEFKKTNKLFKISKR